MKVVQCRRSRSTDVIANLRTHAGRLYPSPLSVSFPSPAHVTPPGTIRTYFQWPQKHVPRGAIVNKFDRVLLYLQYSVSRTHTLPVCGL